MDIAELTVAEGSQRLASGRLTSTDWVQELFDRIERYDSRVNSYISTVRDDALKVAQRADADIRANGMRSPLHGVPYGLKDCIETAGVLTTGHSRLFLRYVPDRSASVAQRLEHAGAILLGKHAMYELSYGGPSFDLPFPPARNPWDLERIPGGSSSGTAAAIAAGLCPAGVGTDAGGSIRQPASFCGVAGLKPTRGLVPHDGIIRISPSLGEAGPMAWTAEDCSLILDVIAGTSATTGIKQDIAGLRIGVARSFFTDSLNPDPDVLAAFDWSVHVLERRGCPARAVDLPDLRDIDAIGRIILLAESYATWEAELQIDPSRFGQIGRHRFMLGAYLSAADYIHALQGRAKAASAVSALFQDVDVIVTAGERSGAPLFEAASDSFPFVAEPSLRMPFTVSGHPALVVRSGFDRNGLPLGLQIIGRHGEDSLVLAVGHAFEQAAGLLEQRPLL
jgi:aspartyl-tRNA(Asn)/glutamyl-tRNA(Gln) amidotransferase subunit A